MRNEWWTEARFGLFIHWGLYALPARHEWVKSREKLSDDAYAKQTGGISTASTPTSTTRPHGPGRPGPPA